MQKIRLTYVIIIFLISSCNSEKNTQESLKETQFDLEKSTVKMLDTIKEERFINFPIPELDSIFPFFETSGVVENSPSERYYNPTDSGLFVFYTLFDKERIKESKYSFDETYIGDLTTHTYRKPKYGWSEKDKDQIFIYLRLNENLIKIGKFIQVGATLKELKKELGQPIYQVDSSFVFLGKNKIIGRFNFENGFIKSLSYGRFNLPDEIFKTDSISRRRIVEKK